MNFKGFTVPVGGAADIPIAGNYVRFYSISAGVANPLIELRTDRGDDVLLNPGDAATLSRPFKNLHITNYQGVQPIIGVLQIAQAGEKLDTSTLLGTVSIIDGNKGRTLAGQTYNGQGRQVGVSAKYAQAQLWNPVGSGVRLILEQIAVSGDGASQQLNFAVVSVALATLLAGVVGSKLAPGAGASVAQVRTNSNVTSGLIGSWNITGAQNVTVLKVFNSPIVLLPGNGLQAENELASAGLQVAFDWYEEANV